MLWTRDDQADRKIRRMLASYARHQPANCTHYSLLGFVGMSLEEFEMWATCGLVSDRNLRCLDISEAGHAWLTAEQAEAVTTDPYLTDLRVYRADAALRMYEGLLSTLDVMTAYLDLLITAAGIEPAVYHALSLDQRLESTVQADGQRALLRAAEVPRRAYEAMPRNSKPRSDVLLAGAAKLGITTRWQGWAEIPEWGLVTDYSRGTRLRPATREEWQRTADVLAARNKPGWYTGAWTENGRAVYVEGGPE